MIPTVRHAAASSFLHFRLLHFVVGLHEHGHGFGAAAALGGARAKSSSRSFNFF